MLILKVPKENLWNSENKKQKIKNIIEAIMKTEVSRNLFKKKKEQKTFSAPLSKCPCFLVQMKTKQA